ncbi:MAG: hypothetical protein CMH26_05610 [Micavibrio sp.]|nr:hypothetical protein [Micavibrio sp.]|tara:strand:- start:1515 stop:3653 length:2139 start_codon:yes stop_codon:yes gene_type:complete
MIKITQLKLTRHLPILAFCIAACPSAKANNFDTSSTLFGQNGLNTIPNARMSEQGTLQFGASTLDPYLNAWLGLQLTPSLNLTLRQSAEISHIGKDSEDLYPGLDLKLRFLKENRTRPELSIGLQSALGHKKMAGEYIALSKRYKSFDFTAGLGWGRFGTAKHFENPLGKINSHFNKDRQISGDMPNEPVNWFTGEHIGLFAGIEYFTPLKGLSLKAEYGADRYSSETTLTDYKAPAPWAIGFNYAASNWADIAIAMQGTDKLMARISFQNALSHMRQKDEKAKPVTPFRPYRTGLALPQEMELAAHKGDIELYNLAIHNQAAHGFLNLKPPSSTPYQLAAASTAIANHAGDEIEQIGITPKVLGLTGSTISISRRDLEMLRARRIGSPQEVWHNTDFSNNTENITSRPISQPKVPAFNFPSPEITLENKLSLSEEDSAALYRTSLIIEQKINARQPQNAPFFFGLLDFAGALRINLKDNLARINKYRPQSPFPIRSNEADFAKRTFGLEQSYLAYTQTLRPDLHVSLIGGYLEEMYAGTSAELLYRPFAKPWAIGIETTYALKRSPDSALNLALSGDATKSTFLKGWYTLNDTGATISTKIGRYLDTDFGAELALEKEFLNGAKMRAFANISDQADYDLFGGTTHSYTGLELKLPLGGYKTFPQNTNIELIAAPIGRNKAQSLNHPMPLYELTEGLTKQHISKYWHEIARP